MAIPILHAESQCLSMKMNVSVHIYCSLTKESNNLCIVKMRAHMRWTHTVHFIFGFADHYKIVRNWADLHLLDLSTNTFKQYTGPDVHSAEQAIDYVIELDKTTNP